MQGNDVYGDGVNIASRLEQQSPKGGMAISDSVYSNIRNKSDLSFKDSGNIKLKNVADTIRVYKIGEEEKTADIKQWKSVTKSIAAFAILILTILFVWFYLPTMRDNQDTDEVTLVVLPFDVLGIEDGESFAEGLQDDILNLLTTDENLKLVSRTSAVNYQRSGLSVGDLADQHNISHVLEGSIRKIGERYKIVAKLIDANTDTNLWSTTIDGGGDDIAGFESSTAEKLAEYIQLSLSSHKDLPTNSIEAYDLFVKAENLLNQRLPGPNWEGVELARKALDIDPDFPEPYGLISWGYADRYSLFGNEKYWADSAVLYAKKMVQLAPESGQAYRALGFALWAQKGAKAAMVQFKTASKLGSNAVHSMMGTIYIEQCKFDSAYFYLRKPKTTNRGEMFDLMRLGKLYLELNLYDSAKHYLEKAYLLNPNLTDLKVELIEASITTEDFEAARQYIDLYLPEDSSEDIIVNTRFMFLAILEARSGNFEEAYKLIKRVPWEGVLNGFLMWKLGNEEGAKELFSQIEPSLYQQIESHGNYPDKYLSLAVCRIGSGDREGALAMVNEAAKAGYCNYDRLVKSLYLMDLTDDPDFNKSLEQVEKNRDMQREKVAALAAR
jgi:adenylate cyclase